MSKRIHKDWQHEKLISAIKTNNLSERKTAAMYNVSRGLIQRIRKGDFDDV